MAASEYQIPTKKKKKRDCIRDGGNIENVSMRPNYTNRQIFTTEEEKEMIENIDDRNTTCYGID